MVDRPLVGLLAGDAASGIYGVPFRFIQAGMVVDTALRVVALQFSKPYTRVRRRSCATFYSTA